MERVKRNQKRRWGLRQYRSLTLYILIGLFCIEGQAAKKTSSFKYKKNLKQQSTIQKRANNKKQVRKKTYKKRRPAQNKKTVKTAPLKNNKYKQIKYTGYKLIDIKPGDIFSKMKLKKEDIIHSIDGKAVHSKKQIHEILSQAEKKQKDFDLFITRKQNYFLISYQAAYPKTNKKSKQTICKKISSKGKTSKKYCKKLSSSRKKRIFFITNIQKLKHKKRTTRKRKVASIKNSKNSTENKAIQSSPTPTNNKKKKKTKKLLVPEKYKSHLQRAYVISLNSFIYEKPDFDTTKLYPLSIGQKIFISKKIFRPPHNFGSFYKVLLTRPKKAVGYVSEVEVVPEFIKENNNLIFNPAYKVAQKQMKEDKVLDVGLVEQMNHKKITNTTKKPRAKSNKKRYVGISVGFLDPLAYPFSTPLPPFEQNLLTGLKLSGYNLLISFINMDINFIFTPYDFNFLHFDVLASFPILKSKLIHSLVIGGLKLDIDRRIEEARKQINPGASAGLALLVPINHTILFRIDALGGYGLSNRAFSSSVSGSLQIAF